MTQSGPRVLVLGYIIRGPLGGLAWHHLQYVLGLAALGCDVCFLEDSDDYSSCYDPSSNTVGTDPSYGLAFIRAAFERLGIADRWAYHDHHNSEWHGPAADQFRSRRSDADILLNVSGVNPLREWTRDVPCRVFIDTDPVFTQIRHLTDPAARQLAEQHTHFFTFGENFGQPHCAIPDDGFAWRPTRQPVVLDAWPTSSSPAAGAFSTVMQWDSYRVRSYGGKEFGMKSSSFPPFLDLPLRTTQRLLLALGSESAPREELARNGWELVDPLTVTRDPWTYQAFIAASRGEFSVAKAGYVSSRSGWFSERTAAYLASGRPVVVQDTGFTSWMAPTDGVLPFDTASDAFEQLERLSREYERHEQAARGVAAQYFDARHVLGGLLSELTGQ